MLSSVVVALGESEIRPEVGERDCESLPRVVKSREPLRRRRKTKKRKKPKRQGEGGGEAGGGYERDGGG